MSQITRAIERIAQVGKKQLPALARQAGVPYTTVVDWKAKHWRPKAVETLERLADAAEELLSKDAEE